MAAPAIKHEGEGVLHIENKVEATCPREELHFNPQKECPQGSNTGMHAIIRFGGGKTITFPAGVWACPRRQITRCQLVWSTILMKLGRVCSNSH
ncbi:MAG TPA: hypothetical protein VEH06_12540 [Candidatus Bathyarchaeia archaeon]|nr:hypothetical protein [Candidatus Bathyarchaeia archaeon]